MSVALLVGPSGAGKSTIGEWAQEDLGLLWLEADLWGADGIDRLRLRSQWDAFYCAGESRRLANTLRRRARKFARAGSLLTLPSTVLLSPAQVESARAVGVAVIVAWGTAKSCLGAFMAREENHPRAIGKDHWLYYNRECLAEYGQPAYATLRLNTFNEDGTRRTRPSIMTELVARLN